MIFSPDEIPSIEEGEILVCPITAPSAGVMLTIDPVTGDRSQITIEGARLVGRENVIAGADCGFSSRAGS